ncbi:MAG: NAD(P)H-dependent glycerol-3-phosphate dehydrogenase [Alphaproteobacteria bacterium]
MKAISVIGAGAWGTALAQVNATNDRHIILWARDYGLAIEINNTRENKLYLPSHPLSQNITATSDLEIACEADIILMVTPAQAMRKILTDMKPHIRNEHKLILCSKGIELSTGKLMSDVAQDILPGTPIAILSGPNFAHEIASGKPAATTLACTDEALARELQSAITGTTFRAYITNDIIGAQIAGALKNVIAIACGASKAMEAGESARASLVTRGLAEIARLGHAMGADYETFLGLSGVGDMMLTCSSEKSRNFSLGLELGMGKNIANTLKNSRNVTEGIHTAQAALMLADKYNINMPIAQAVHKCVNEGIALDEVMHELLNRPVGHEL